MGHTDLFRFFALLALEIFGEYGSDERDEDANLCLLFMAKILFKSSDAKKF